MRVQVLETQSSMFDSKNNFHFENLNVHFFCRAMLALGASKPWPDAMEVLTGTRKMEANAIMEYFKPLHEWLVTSNEANGLHVGWKKSYR